MGKLSVCDSFVTNHRGVHLIGHGKILEMLLYKQHDRFLLVDFRY